MALGTSPQPRVVIGFVSGPMTDLDPLPDGRGYRVLDAAGYISTFRAQAPDDRDAVPLPLQPGELATSISNTLSGEGYWVFTSQGRAFGDVACFGSMGGIRLNGLIVGIAPDPDGAACWLVAADGGIFSFSDLPFHGSLEADPPTYRIAAVAPLVMSEP